MIKKQLTVRQEITYSEAGNDSHMITVRLKTTYGEAGSDVFVGFDVTYCREGA